MSPGSSSSSAALSHPVRPGITLLWGREFPLPPDTLAVFAFVIHGPRIGDPGEMSVRCALTPAALVAPDTFGVTLAVGSAAFADLLSGESTPATSRIQDTITSAGLLSLPLTAAARLAVESIHRCPFVGGIRSMALTARGNDLLVEFLTALAAAGTAPVPLLRTAGDQLRAAADLLSRRLEDPPTLADLARQVGLSETTLKRGFHQVFGTTVFGYLRARRMERAHALLQSGEATVLEAAALVGYSNPSNFSAAFRRQFGVNPKAFQLSRR
jgi:AraC-like DNA-binding protein